MQPNTFRFAALAATFLSALSAQTHGGGLYAVRDGIANLPCPLKRTDVKAEISGFVSRVTVTQNFENPLNEKIEAVYVFPLSQNGAVDSMTMTIGDRVIQGKIKPREEAQAIYEAARNAGRTASLLEQERPNIFTQSVANIRPGEAVKITITYVETLRYEAGSYEFVFPMVVGPRYIPGGRTSEPSRISPPVTLPGTRAGHDVTVEVSLDAGVPVQAFRSTSHEVITERRDAHRATVRLKDLAVIPNKDFILKYDVAGQTIADALLSHRDSRGGFFSLILQPPKRAEASEITPKEIVFVVDTSGSMHGFPLDKSKEVMRTALANLNPRDTFNFITFSGDTAILFPEPVAATPENVEKAQRFLESRRGQGGTEMMKAIRAALEPTRSREHVRIVAFLTDGYVGNDTEIIAEVKKYSNARVFSFGIGSSVNRFLLDKMAEAGRGEVEYVTLNDDGSAAARRFYERMRSPLLTDIRMEWNGLAVNDVLPNRIPDLFAAKPLVIQGRYDKPGRGNIRLIGKMAGREVVRNIAVDLPAAESRNESIASLWARTKVDALMDREQTVDHRAEVVRLGLAFRLLTQFTAFVAVEEKTVTEGGQPGRIEVPVEMPAGVSYRGVFGERDMGMEPKLMGTPASHPAGFGGMLVRKEMTPHIVPRAQVVVDEITPRQPMEDRSLNKLHPDLLSMVRGGVTGAVPIEVYVATLDAGTLQALKNAGFELLRKDAVTMVVSGRIDRSKLRSLAAVPQVKYIVAAR